jgi:hypothetical protein
MLTSILVSVVNLILLYLFFIDQKTQFDQDYFTFSMISLQTYELQNNVLIWVVFSLTIVYSLSGHAATYMFGLKRYKFLPK